MAEIYTSNGSRPAPAHKIRKLANVALNIDGTVGQIETVAVEIRNLTSRLDVTLARFDEALDSLNVTLGQLTETTSSLARTTSSIESLIDVVEPMIRVLKIALYPTKVFFDFADERVAQIERALNR